MSNERSTNFSVTSGRALSGTVEVPGDKSVSHRALIFGALADGQSVIRGLSNGQDVARTEQAMREIGAGLSHESGPNSSPLGSRDHETTIDGGTRRLHQPQTAIDCGNSGTSIRLIAGLVAGFPWNVELTGDESLSSRPMDRIAEPLQMMGAGFEGTGDRLRPPVTISGGKLKGIKFAPRQASAQVKSCVLLAALHAEGETVVREAVPTRRHTEELLEICGGDIEESSAGSGHSITVRPSELGPFELEIPGDPSQAAFWIVAACIVPGSEIHLPDVYAGSGRRGFLDVLLRMGADIDERSTSERESVSLGASSDIVVRSSPLRGTEIHAEEITGLDEVPILAVAAALAEGSTTFFDVGELRVKESDRLAGIVGLLEAFGARGEISGDNLIVHGASGLAHGHVQSKGDHRMAMSAAVAGLAATGDGTTTIEGWESVQTSYPGFADDLETLAGSGSRP